MISLPSRAFPRAVIALAAVAGLALFATIILQASVVVFRGAFGIGLPVVQDLVIALSAIAILLGIPVALARDAHVRVTGWSSRHRRVDAIGMVVLVVPFGLALLWLSWPYAMRSVAIGEGSPDPDGLGGVYVVKIMIVVAAALLTAVAVARCATLHRAASSSGDEDDQSRPV